jgi:hypothetical protein
VEKHEQFAETGEHQCQVLRGNVIADVPAVRPFPEDLLDLPDERHRGRHDARLEPRVAGERLTDQHPGERLGLSDPSHIRSEDPPKPLVR